MESYEKKSEEAGATADRLAGEGDRVEERIKETKRDVESKQAPGLPDADDMEAAGGHEEPEARGEDEEPAADADR